MENYEKKYKDALERAKNYYSITDSVADIELIELIFPELKQSGEQKQDPCEHCDNVMLNCHNFPCIKKRAFEQRQSVFDVINEEDTDNQNCVQAINKVVPKFHEGDWTVSNLDGKVRQISEVHFSEYNSYYVVNGKCVNLEEYDRLHHIWTIQDAKDGDVLFSDLMCGKTFIYKGVNSDMAILYSFIISNDGKDVLPYHIGKLNTGIGNIEDNKNIIHPATKEQCDLLFSKIKEAGYEYDENKKELKKITQKLIANIEPNFYEGDWVVYNNDICKIVKREEGCNKLVTVFGIEKELVNERNLSTARLWTIDDAKEGDILANKANDAILIFKTIKNYYIFSSYCDYFVNTFRPKQFSQWASSAFIPATKEQCELLFQRMREAGWEWDAKKKELKKIEQKPADKIKPKFKVGDWIVWQDKCYKVNYNGCGYELIDQNSLSMSLEYGTIDKNVHLWSIADAKDGDVLLSKHNQPFIYNGIFDEESVGAYCGIDKLGNDFLTDIFSCDWSYKEGVKPATKEQSDLLFLKMKKAGYEWDKENKELKKFHVIDEGKAEIDYCFTKMMNGEKVNSVWSEEDEKMVKDIIAAIDTLYYHGMVKWLKSLKNRVQPQNMWKPSKEQIVALRWILNNIPYNKHKEEISGLLDQIKDL